MPRPQHITLIKIALCGMSILAFAAIAGADPPPTTQPTLLQQLSQETQKLYSQSRHSIVRVRLPTPQWLEDLNNRQDFLRKWGPVMDPAVRQKIIDQQDRAMLDLHPVPSSAPVSTTQPSGTEIRARVGESNLVLYAVGVLVDDQGHAVFPVFVDHKWIGDSPLSAVTGDGQVTTAKFVGSDAKTNLTVLQLADNTGTPAILGNSRPQDGSLTLVIARDGAARLIVWNNQHPEPGFAVLTDGSVAGFGFGGYFLESSTAKPIVDQLIATGEVHRAILGVHTIEVDKDDPIRRQRPELGTSPALLIQDVKENSAAARGGIRPNDLVLTIGGQTVGDAPTFAAVIATRRGATTLRVLRGNTIVELTVNLQPN